MPRLFASHLQTAKRVRPKWHLHKFIFFCRSVMNFLWSSELRVASLRHTRLPIIRECVTGKLSEKKGGKGEIKAAELGKMGKRQFRVNWQMENLHFNTYEISPNGVNASRNCWVSISELKSPTKMWNCSAKKERECQVEYRFFRRFSQIFTGTFGERVDAVGASWIAQNMRQIKTQIKRETQVMRFYFAIYCQRWRCALMHIHKKSTQKLLEAELSHI